MINVALLVINRLYWCPPPVALESADAHRVCEWAHAAEPPHAHARAVGVAALRAPVAATARIIAGLRNSVAAQLRKQAGRDDVAPRAKPA